MEVSGRRWCKANAAHGLRGPRLSISRRSNRLMFVQLTRDMDIYRVDINANPGETRASMPLIVSSRLDRFPRYSPDGSSIAFASLRSGNWQLWVSNSDGSNPQQLTSFEGAEVRRPVWSTDGKQIRFNCNTEG